MNVKRILIILTTVVFVSTSAPAQEIALKSNLLYDATTTLNIGAEFGISSKITLDVSGNLNAWTFGGGKQWRHWLIQPEARYWLSQKFNGHFVGLHAHGGNFNVANIKFIDTENERHQGYLLGAGLTYGYNWALSSRWKLEAAIGLGMPTSITTAIPAPIAERNFPTTRSTTSAPPSWPSPLFIC